MSNIHELIVKANRASVEDISKDLKSWCEFMEDEGVTILFNQSTNEVGVKKYSVIINFQDMEFKFKARSLCTYCAFEPIEISIDGATYIARSTGTDFIIKDTNGHLIDASSPIYNIVKILHARIKFEL